MRFFSQIIDTLIGFVQRHPIATLIIIFLPFVPSALLHGITLIFLSLIGGILLLVCIGGIYLHWRLRQAQRTMESQFRHSGHGGFNSSSQYNTRQRASSTAREGDIHIHQTNGTPEKRISKDVGDYVDFEETRS